MRPALCLFLFLNAVAALAEPAPARAWNEEVIYFAMTDRFADGDPANNVPRGSDPALYDAAQEDVTKYHGGDLRGLERAISGGYFEALGVTAIWISPPVRNVWNSLAALGGPKTGYHGYWAQDFLDIDPHIVSSRSPDGAREYADTRDGRMQHYKDFVALAHAHGLKVIQDIVCNHAGPVFYYDGNLNGQLDRDQEMEWRMPYRAEGYDEFAKWMSAPEWNALPTMPGGPVSVLGRAVKTTGLLQKFETYGRKGMSDDSLWKRNGEEVKCDVFAQRDLSTAPDAPHFSALVDEFVEIYGFYLEEIGVDGFRLDTVKHVHREFWEAFTERLRAKVGPERAKKLLIFGEVQDGAQIILGRYTYRQEWPARKDPSLDSVLNLPLSGGVRGFLRHALGRWGPVRELEGAVQIAASDSFNPTPGADGLNARQKMVNCIENHDGLNRFRVPGISARSNLLANAMMLTMEGIPCLYYGTEAALEDARGKLIGDSETGRMTFILREKPERLGEARGSVDFKELAAVTRLRRDLPALTAGQQQTLWADTGETRKDDGIFAVARYIEHDGKVDTTRTVVVVFNAGTIQATTGLPGKPMQLLSKSGEPLMAQGERLVLRQTVPLTVERAPTVRVAWVKKKPTAEIAVTAKSVAIFTVQKQQP